jgi:bacteriocin biosynthesis cyclodehydratase domain-containing protein
VRPVIRPGVRILRRDLHTVQVGQAWPGVVLLTDSPALRAVLAAIDGYRDSAAVVLTAGSVTRDTDACAAALDLLIDTGAVVDGAHVAHPPGAAATWGALWLVAGPTATAADVLAMRQACRVHVSGDGGVADAVRQLLPKAHVSLATGSDDATLLVLVDAREPDRARSDQAMRSGLPHVWGYLRDLVGVLGPFVVPGKSACLRCVDLARRELDPTWPMMLAPTRSVDPPEDPVLAALVGAAVAQEVVAWASGYHPRAWDAVVEIPYSGSAVEHQAHPPHPQCGCGWAGAPDTMGA